LYLAYDAPHEPYHIDDTSWYDEKGEWSMNTKRYAALVSHMDYNIGRVLGTLDALGLRENTLVIFASDNGAAVMAPIQDLNSGAGLKGHKGQLYEGGIKVPVIVNQPGKVPVQKLNNIIYFPDFMPTFAKITGCTKSLPKNINGMDISPLFYGEQMDTDNRYLYWEFPGKQRAIRFGKWKAESIGKNKPLELYNIEDDKYETTNLADKYPKLLKQLDKQMKKMRTPSEYWPIEGEKGYKNLSLKN
jgi:arylsulfatase A-like enzyme